MKQRLLHLAFVAMAVAGPMASPASAQRVSVDSAGSQGNGASLGSSISADGRYVVFQSAATNLVTPDGNGAVVDVYMHDRVTGQTTRLSVSSTGTGSLQGNFTSDDACISDDGSTIAFQSIAWTLLGPAVGGVYPDSNGLSDIYVRIPGTGETERVSISSNGGQAMYGGSYAPAISADGNFVAFETDASNLIFGGNDTNGCSDIFVRDRNAGTTTRVSVADDESEANGPSYAASISGDGNIVVFQSAATNLIGLGNDTNGCVDIFVRNVSAGTTTRISISTQDVVANGDSGAPCISLDGTQVAFSSVATNLLAGGADSNGFRDVFVRNLTLGTTSRVSVDSAGAEADDLSNFPAVTADGRYVVFSSQATDLVSGDTNGKTDIFIHDRLLNTTSMVHDVTNLPDDSSGTPSIASLGRYVGFASSATNIVSGDTNGVADVFVYDRGPTPTMVRTGACPSAGITLEVYDATPSGSVVFIRGSAGSSIKSGSPCMGLLLSVSSPAVIHTVTASVTGYAWTAFPGQSVFCGYTVQAIDVTTCVTTNTDIL